MIGQVTTTAPIAMIPITIVPPILKKGPYWCGSPVCGGRDREEHQVHWRFDHKVMLCNICGKEVVSIKKGGESGEEGPRAAQTQAGSIIPPTSPGASPSPTLTPMPPKVPPVPFREAMRVNVSQFERDLHQDLLKAFEEGRLPVRPFLNDDHRVGYVVREQCKVCEACKVLASCEKYQPERETFPDIYFEGTQVPPLYLDNTETHDEGDAWDNEARRAIEERVGVSPMVIMYSGRPGAGERAVFVELVIDRCKVALQEAGRQKG